MTFHTLTFARSRGRCWKPRPEAEVSSMYWKIMFDRCYCINSTIYLLKFWETLWHYILSASECTFLNIRLPGPSASRDSRWLPSFDSTSMFQNDSTVQGCCSTTVECSSRPSAKWDSNPSTKTEKGLPLYANISLLNEPNPFLCRPAVLRSRNFATCFLSQLFYSQFDIVKIWRQHCF